jgi:hypothetical protein
VSTTAYGVLGTLVGLVWFAVILAVALWVRRGESRAEQV